MLTFPRYSCSYLLITDYLLIKYWHNVPYHLLIVVPGSHCSLCTALFATDSSLLYLRRLLTCPRLSTIICWIDRNTRSPAGRSSVSFLSDINCYLRRNCPHVTSSVSLLLFTLSDQSFLSSLMARSLSDGSYSPHISPLSLRLPITQSSFHPNWTMLNYQITLMPPKSYCMLNWWNYFSSSMSSNLVTSLIPMQVQQNPCQIYGNLTNLYYTVTIL